MSTERPRFSLFIYFYLAIFFLLLGFLPVCLAATTDRADVPAFWLASLFWPVALAGMWVYAKRRCTSDHIRFNDGLLWVTASMSTGWLYFSFFFVLPVLFVVFFGAVLIALYGDVRRAPARSPARYQRLVHYFYRNRMRQ
jgi:hypothetical protein